MQGGLHCLTANRTAPVVCIQKASALWTRRGPGSMSAADLRSWEQRETTDSGVVSPGSVYVGAVADG
jgi:hypothetical protein